METDDDDLESKEMGVDTKGKKIRKIVLKYLFFLLSLVFAVALVGVVTQFDFSPYFTEHAQELSKHRTRGEEVEFHAVSNIEKFPHKDQRLPKDLKPLSYKLDLRVNLTTLKYRGVVKTRILCEKTTRYVILHCGDLEVLNVSVTAENNHDLAINGILAFKEYQQLCVELKGDLCRGESYFVTIQFKNKISDKLEGFYKSWYRSETGEKRMLAVSHFEPAHARKAFPCFDEPSFKASFNISIIHDPQLYALSNMPRARLVTRKDGLVEEHFLPSVNMSTYLVAFAVVDFRYKEKMTSSGVLVRVHAPPSDFDRLEYALDTGVKVLSFYETLFGEPFPLPKLDLLAVPDFLNGAMEEWGLVVFRRALLVYDEQFTSTDAKVKMTKVIAHELAHQWFGNLVTPRWWNDLWLNEGFAVFVEDEFGANYVMNGWDMRETVVSTSWKSALHGDSMWSSHPISVEVQKPEEIDDIFDAISYQKGAMILRMLMNYLGVEKFLNGIKGYLETYKYGNADAEELWDAIGEASGDINVKKMMRVWTDQKGFPIVSIRRKGRVFHIEQEDVLDKLMKDKKQAQNRKRWYLPISYFTESDPTVRWVTIPPHTQSYPLTTVSTSGWIMANINATGFFMVNYDEENWKKLAAQLRKDHQVFTPNDRAGLIHDVFTLACQGLLDPVLALNLSTYLVQEKHPVPWALARGKSKCLMGLLSKAHKLLYKNYLWSLQDHLIDLVGMEDTGNDLERFFRYDVLSEAMRSGQRKEIRERFIRLFNELKETPLGSLPSVGPNFRYLAFSFGVNKSSEEDWHYLWSVYQQSPFDTDRKFLMRVITSFNTENIRSKNLLFSLDENRVRPQDSLFWIEMMGKGRGKMDDRWEFILKHWKTLARRYAGSYKFGNLIKAVAGSFHSKDQLKMVKKTFQSLTPGEIAVRAQSQTVEKIQHNIAGNPAHLKTSEKRIVRWLKDYKRIS